jgi:hypothetical protein
VGVEEGVGVVIVVSLIFCSEVGNLRMAEEGGGAVVFVSVECSIGYIARTGYGRNSSKQ